jgi:hypothetical protein
MFEFLTFEIQIFQTTLNGYMTKTKVVDLKMLYCFVTSSFEIF